MSSKKQKINGRGLEVREVFDNLDFDIKSLLRKLERGVVVNDEESLLLKRQIQETRKCLQGIKRK
jgi:hypothetical protein